MHVGFLSNEYPLFHSGGIGTSIKNLATALIEKNHRVTVFGIGPTFLGEDQGVKIKFFKPSRIPKLGCLIDRCNIQKEINLAVANDGLDIVEAADWQGSSLGLKLNCPLVIRCHGSVTYFNHLRDSKISLLAYWIEKLALTQADDVVAVSRYAADTTKKIFDLKRTIGVIHNGINLKRFKVSPNNSYELNTILYFGALVKKKGLYDLAEIFSLLVEILPEAKLVIAGRDSLDKEKNKSAWAVFEELLTKKAREKTEYLGQLAYDRIHECIESSALCVFPSYAEAFPVSWLEAMACGKPVVAYDIGWAEEVVKNNITGCLVKAGDTRSFAKTLAQLLRNSKNVAKLGMEARRRVEDHFSNEIIANQSVEWYQRIISKKRSAK